MFQYFYKHNSPKSVLPHFTVFQNKWKNLDISFLGSICIPSICTLEDAEEILEMSFKGHDVNIGSNISCKEGFQKDSLKWKVIL